MDVNVEIRDLSGEEERAAAARSRVYAALASCFRFPTEEFHASVAGGTLRDELGGLLAGLPYDFGELGALSATCSYDDFQAEYIRLFDVGVGGPPCPLYGGHYGRARMRVMEEVMRFYSHFGLSLSSTQRELPDHLTTELEFLHYLSFCETRALHAGHDCGAFRRATRDFLERQVVKWLPLMAAKLAKQEPLQFFADLVSLTVGFTTRDRNWVEGLLKRAE